MFTHRVLVMPTLGTMDAIAESTGQPTQVNQLGGSTADQPRDGIALANVPQVVTYEDGNSVTSGRPSDKWGWLSQTMPATILVPSLEWPGGDLAAQQWIDMAQTAAPRGAIPEEQRVTITTVEPINGEGRDNVVRHELAGAVADQLVTLAAARPMHYVANALTVDGGDAVSRFEYFIDDPRRAPLIKMRVLATHCWLQRVEATDQTEQASEGALSN